MKKVIVGMLLSVAMLFLAIAIGLGLLHCCDWLYRLDISALKISENAGISAQDALDNYHAVMDYLSPFNNSEFSLPTLAFGEVSVRHFADVKNVFNMFYLFGLCGAALIVGLWTTKCISKKSLKISAVGVLALPIVVLAGVSINFDASFVFFHSLFFEGKTWYLSPSTDQIIKILPEKFFLHCAIVIVVCIILSCVIQFIIAAKSGRNNEQR